MIVTLPNHALLKNSFKVRKYSVMQGYTFKSKNIRSNMTCLCSIYFHLYLMSASILRNVLEMFLNVSKDLMITSYGDLGSMMVFTASTMRKF